MPRIMSINGLVNLEAYVDASHASHFDMRGQTGGCILLDKGVLHSRSSKQSINTKSSTETELVGNSDYLPYVIWTLNFLQEQGYKVQKRTLYQDNQSTIKMLKNGKRSCGKQSRHILIRYFWICDRLMKEQVKVEYCPTQMMLADFFTKPLQGSLFKVMRDVIQGLTSPDELKSLYEQKTKTEQPLIVKERVGNN